LLENTVICKLDQFCYGVWTTVGKFWTFDAYGGNDKLLRNFEVKTQETA